MERIYAVICLACHHGWVSDGFPGQRAAVACPFCFARPGFDVYRLDGEYYKQTDPPEEASKPPLDTPRWIG